MALTPITITNPVVVPQQTFNLAALKFLRIDWPNLNGPVSAQYALQPYYTDEYGVNHASLTQPIVGRMNDLLGMAASRATDGKPLLAEALAAVLAALEEIAHENGQI